MKGQPFRELLIIGLLFIGLLIPMFRLTGLSAERTVLDFEEEQELLILRDAWVTLRFAHPPEACKLTVNGINMWTILQPEDSLIDRSMPLPIENRRVEILVQVTWPEGTPESVCELTIEPDGLEGRTISMWGEASLDEIYSFHWEQP